MLDSDKTRDKAYKHSKEPISLQNGLAASTNTLSDFAKAQNVMITDTVRSKKTEIVMVQIKIAKYVVTPYCSFHVPSCTLPVIRC